MDPEFLRFNGALKTESRNGLVRPVASSFGIDEDKESDKEVAVTDMVSIAFWFGEWIVIGSLMWYEWAYQRS